MCLIFGTEITETMSEETLHIAVNTSNKTITSISNMKLIRLILSHFFHIVPHLVSKEAITYDYS